MGHAQTIEPISAADYLAGEPYAAEKHEFIDGQVYAMAGASERHNRVSMNIGFYLRSATRGTSCKTFMSDMKFHHAARNIYYYPDVMLLCDPGDGDGDADEYSKQRPCLIAEVLSPSTASIDRREKWHTYRNTPSLRYYLLVNPDTPIVEVYSRTQGDHLWQHRTLGLEDILTIHCPPIQVTLSLRDIYEDVDVIPLV